MVEGSGVECEGRGDIGVRFDPSTFRQAQGTAGSGHRRLNELRVEEVPEFVVP